MGMADSDSENVEMSPINKLESDKNCNHPPATVSRLNSTNEDLRDVEQTPTSTMALISSDLKSYPVQREPLLILAWRWALLFLAPTISIAYLAFCYVVHYYVVPMDVSGLNTGLISQVLLTNIGAGVTSINIIIISLALFPLKGLLSELQSEEFFRLLSARSITQGIQLSTVNGISTLSYGLIESIMAIINLRCSAYYVTSFVAAVIILALSTLAPAALSIQPILVDGAIVALSVGAIPPLALYQPVAGGQTIEPASFSPAPGYAAAIVWAEREIGLSYSFSVSDDPQGEYSGFVVPTPSTLNSTESARWLTDVIGLNPYCTWANPVNLTSTSLNYTMNSTEVPSTALSVHLDGLNLQANIPSSYFPVWDSYFVTSINVHDPTVTVFNYTTGSLPTDGAMVMSVIQCASTSCTGEAINIISTFIDFTDIPSLNFSTIGVDYNIGFLVCKPNITIETREVRTQGSMKLGVQPLANGAPLPSQGNLDWTQTSLLVAFSLSGLTTDSGPSSSAWFGLGSGTQADFMFGAGQMDAIPSGAQYENSTLTLTPLPLDQLAQGYTQMVKASMKPYVSGLLGTKYVPGRVASVQQIFVSSFSHVFVSTALVAILFTMAIVAHFRPRKGDHFNLTNIAAVLADSDLPEVVKHTKMGVITELERDPRRRRRWFRSSRNVDREVARRLGNRKVVLGRSAKAEELEALHISGE